MGGNQAAHAVLQLRDVVHIGGGASIRFVEQLGSLKADTATLAAAGSIVAYSDNEGHGGVSLGEPETVLTRREVFALVPVWGDEKSDVPGASHQIVGKIFRFGASVPKTITERGRQHLDGLRVSDPRRWWNRLDDEVATVQRWVGHIIVIEGDRVLAAMHTDELPEIQDMWFDTDDFSPSDREMLAPGVALHCEKRITRSVPGRKETSVEVTIPRRSQSASADDEAEYLRAWSHATGV